VHESSVNALENLFFFGKKIDLLQTESAYQYALKYTRHHNEVTIFLGNQVYCNHTVNIRLT